VRRFALTGFLVAALSTSAAHGLEAPWGLVQTGDGTLYVVAGGTRHRITPVAVPEDIIAAIPEGDAWEQGRIPGAPAASVETFTLATAPLLAPTLANGVIEVQGSGTEKSRSFRLSGGTYLIRWTATPRAPAGCQQSGALQGRDQVLQQYSIANEIIQDGAPRSGETRAYAVKPGDYLVNMNSGCDWRVTIIPQP
jgi:hypothetical protein